jgi:hypothetical protein
MQEGTMESRGLEAKAHEQGEMPVEVADGAKVLRRVPSGGAGLAIFDVKRGRRTFSSEEDGGDEMVQNRAGECCTPCGGEARAIWVFSFKNRGEGTLRHQ